MQRKEKPSDSAEYLISHDDIRAYLKVVFREGPDDATTAAAIRTAARALDRIEARLKAMR